MEKQAGARNYLDQPSPSLYTLLSVLCSQNHRCHEAKARGCGVKRLKEKEAKGARKGEKCPCLANDLASLRAVQGFRQQAAGVRPSGPCKR